MSITVMLGGFSSEREVSLQSGQAVAEALRRGGHIVNLLDVQDEQWTLPAGTEVVFIALHGTYGEDGQVQTRLEALGIPYTGCDPKASQTAFDKVRTKERLIEAGLPTATHEVVHDADTPFPEALNPPVVLKPVREGSSVGLRFVETRDEWPAALRECHQFGGEVLVEEKILGHETTVGILEGRALPLVEVRPRSGRYDYEHKYTEGMTEHLCPAPFPEEVTTRIQSVGQRAFEVIGARDYARVDVMVSEDGAPFILEINTLPGMTPLSLLPEAAAAAGISFDELCLQMVRLAWRRGPAGAEAADGS